MKHRTKILMPLVSALIAGPAIAADDDVLTHGKAVYDQWCVICHGPDERGTRILEDRYQGAVPGELIKRQNLTPELITLRVRTWDTLMMPVFRPTEVSDADLEAVITYLMNNQTGEGN